MRGNLSFAEISAIKPLAEHCQQRQDFAEPLWFAGFCRYLWGPNAPKELAFALARNEQQRPERTCRAWASGESPPPLTIMLVLLCDDIVGGRALSYVMRGCDAPHWRERERQRLDSELLRKLVDEITR